MKAEIKNINMIKNLNEIRNVALATNWNKRSLS